MTGVHSGTVTESVVGGVEVLKDYRIFAFAPGKSPRLSKTRLRAHVERHTQQERYENTGDATHNHLPIRNPCSGSSFPVRQPPFGDRADLQRDRSRIDSRHSWPCFS